MKKLICMMLVFCLMFSLAGEAAASALTPHIESVRATEDGKYTVEGSIDDYDSASGGSLYTASYYGSGKMAGIGNAAPDAEGNWSVSGVSIASETDIVKAFVVSDKTKGFAPQGKNDSVLAVNTMAGLTNALISDDNSPIFIAKDITLSTTQSIKTIGINKSVTVSKGVTLTVPNDYTLQLNSGAKLTVGGTLSIAQSALVVVAGSYTKSDGEYIGAAELVLGGGTVNNAGTLRLWTASTETSVNYDGGSGGFVTGSGKGGTITSTGTIEINGGYTDNTLDVYNNGGSMDITNFTVTVSDGGRLQNDSWLCIREEGALNGTGTVQNNSTLRLEGGIVTGELIVENKNNLQLFKMYIDDGSGSISVNESIIDETVTLSQKNGWTYEAAQATTEAALKYALTNYTGENIELAGNSPLNIGSIDIPSGKRLRTNVPMNLTSGSTANVNGSIELYSQFTVSPTAVLNIAKTGELEAQCSGNQKLLNAGTITANGVLWVGKRDENNGYFRNTGTVTVGTDGGLYVLPGSTLENGGSIIGAVTLFSDGTITGVLMGTTATTRTALEVSSYNELITAASGSYGALSITDGFELGNDFATTKELIVAENAWLRILSGKALTLNGGLQLFGWMENRGTIAVVPEQTARLRGNLYNSGGDEKGTIVVSGTLDIYPGKLLKNNGTFTITGSGAISIGGTLCWGNEDAMPVIGTTAGYSSYGTGSIVPTSRKATSADEFNELLSNNTCDNIVLGYNITITEDTVFKKGVTVPSGYTLTVDSGVTLAVTDGAWLNVNSGTFNNKGTVIVANDNNNQGHININGGSTLTNNGNIEVYGEFKFNNRENTTISGSGSLTYHYYTNLVDLSKGLYSLLGTGYGLTVVTDTDYSTYAGAYSDWGDVDDNAKLFVAFALKNMTDRSILAKTYEGDYHTYLKPCDQMSYGTIMQVLEQIWDAVKKDSSNLPASVCLTGKQNSSVISNYDYGTGSEIYNLLSSLMTAIGNIEVTAATTFTVNETAEQQYISFKTFKEAVTIVRDDVSGNAIDNINFYGCEFEKGITIVSSGVRFTTILENCALNNVTDKSCNIYIEPKTSSGEPTFDVTNGESEVNILLTGTTAGVAVMANGCDAHVMSYIAGGSFTINGVQYFGDSELSTDDRYEGKYQLDKSEGVTTESFHAGEHTVRVAANGVDFREFHAWGNIKNNITLELTGVMGTGGNLNISDDYTSNDYFVTVTGSVGDSTNDTDTTLSLYLNGKVDISGLTAHNTNISAGRESTIRLETSGEWLFPTVIGDYSSAAINIGAGNLVADDYTFTLYKIMRDQNGNEYLGEPEGTSIHYEAGNDSTFVYGLPDTGGLMLDVTYGGKTVRWDEMNRKYDAVDCANFANELYTIYGSDTAHFTGAGNAAEFVIENGLMTNFTGNPVTMYEAVQTLTAVADKLGVTFKDYYTDNELARVDYSDNISYGDEFEAKLLSMASAFALGSKYSPYYTWDSEKNSNVLAVGFDGQGTIGRTKMDSNNNTELSQLLEAFKTACEDGVYIGDSPKFRDATFEGAVTMTMGKSQWSNFEFNNCTFKDKTGESQALNIKTDHGMKVNFSDDCTYTVAGGLAINLEPVTDLTYNTEDVYLNNFPSGTVFSSTYVKFYAGCRTSEGTLKINGVTVTGLDFDNYDGLGQAYPNHFFAAGIWWDDYGDGKKAPTLGFSGGVASVDVPAACTMKFGAFNAGDDCPYDITLNIAGGWTPNYNCGLSLRSHSAHTLKLTGSVTGGTGEDESAPEYTILNLSLTGTVDITSATISGNYFVVTGYWSDVNQNLSLGNENIAVIYDKNNNANKNFAISIGNNTNSLDTGVVLYFASDAEKNVRINGFSGIAMTEVSEAYRVYLGGLTQEYSSGSFGAYTLSLYKFNDSMKAWEALPYTLDTSDTTNFALVPTTPQTVPLNVLLSVKFTDPVTSDSDDSRTFNVLWSYSGEASGESTVNSASELASALANNDINKIFVNSDITLSLPEGQSAATYEFKKDVVIKEGLTLTVAENVTLNILADHGIAANGVLSVAGEVNVYGWLDGGNDWGSHVKTTGTGIINTYASLEDFAVGLYNRYSVDYGLLNSAVKDTYEGFYAEDYFIYENSAAGIAAINFLIENGVISSGATNINGWAKLPYSTMMEMLGSLADAIEVKNPSLPEITGYGVEDLEDAAYLCKTENNSNFNILLGSFAESVGTIGIASAVEYAPGLYDYRLSLYKIYGSDVTVNCTAGESDFLLFMNCTFNSDLIIYGGTGTSTDEIRLLNCTINGNIIVKDDDGNTNVYFDGATEIKTVITSSNVSSYDQYFITSAATIAMDSNNALIYSYTCVMNGVASKTVVSHDPLTKGTLYFAKDYDANGAILTEAAYSGPSHYSALYTELTDIAYSGGKLIVTGAKSGSYTLNDDIDICLCRVTATGTNVSMIDANTAAEISFSASTDKVYLMYTSNSNHTIAAAYIFTVGD